LGLVLAGLGFARASAAAEEPAVPAVVESTMTTAKGQIRQFAMDGDEKTYFLSDQNPTKKDSFTIKFDKPVALKSVHVKSGYLKQGKLEDDLETGVLEASTDGTKFQEIGKFAKGEAESKKMLTGITELRIQPGADLNHPLAIREVTIDSQPAVSTFKYPIEITTDATDAPELKDWLDKTARVCEREYPMINEALKSPGFVPAHTITMTLKKDYKGVAETGGNRIKGSVDFYTKNQKDVGSMVHETVHVVQAYHSRGNPGWLVEGIADYIRFFKYEPGKVGRIDANRAHYNGSYRVTASFLNYVSEKYDKDLVTKLNQAMREGKYKEELFKDYTQKSLSELDDEWRATLKK
jgi:hypothetical protein